MNKKKIPIHHYVKERHTSIVIDARKIIFRGKSERKGWIYGELSKVYLDFKKDKKLVLSISPFDMVYENGYSFPIYTVVISGTVGQFIGKADCYDTPIYEHDIVRNIETGQIGIVSFDYRGACVNGHLISHLIDLRLLEVIGNIHDNACFLDGANMMYTSDDEHMILEIMNSLKEHISKRVASIQPADNEACYKQGFEDALTLISKTNMEVI